jgi:hypothetical protein
MAIRHWKAKQPDCSQVHWTYKQIIEPQIASTITTNINANPLWNH